MCCLHPKNAKFRVHLREFDDNTSKNNTQNTKAEVFECLGAFHYIANQNNALLKLQHPCATVAASIFIPPKHWENFNAPWICFAIATKHRDKNHKKPPIVKENHLPNHHFQVHVNLQGCTPRNLKQIQANTTSLQQTSKTLGDTHFAIRIRITTSLKKSHVPNNSRGPKTNSRIRWFFVAIPKLGYFCFNAKMLSWL